MMSTTPVRKSEVPVYLYKSELYLSLDESDDEFSVPGECMKMNVEVKNLSDLRNILLTMRYWILPAFPCEVIDYIFTCRHPDMVVRLLSEFDSAFPKVRDLVRNIYTSLGSNRACHLSAEFGRVDFLDFFAKKGTTLDIETLKIAAENGHSVCVAYCLDFISNTGPLHLEDVNWCGVVQKGHLECITLLVHRGASVETFLALAVEIGSVQCLKYLHNELHFDCWVPAIMAAAAKAGPLELVKQLHIQGCPWDESATVAAVCAFRWECAEYLISQKPISNMEVLLQRVTAALYAV